MSAFTLKIARAFTHYLFKDSLVNYAGHCLARMARSLNLYILNGSTCGDHPGEFTFMVGTRCSTINYILVSEIIILFVRSFHVLLDLDTDHLLLLLHLMLPNQQTHPETQSGTYIMWTEWQWYHARRTTNLELSIKETLISKNVSVFWTAILDNSVDCDPLISYDQLVQRLKPLVSLLRHKQKKWQGFLNDKTSSLDTLFLLQHLLKKSYKQLVT